MNIRFTLATLAGVLSLSLPSQAVEPATPNPTASAAPASNVAAAATSHKAVVADRQTIINTQVATALGGLKIQDAAKESKVRGILADHFGALEAWHQTHDAELKSLWAEFDKARSPKSKDPAGEVAANEKIMAVYATFKPQHEAFLAKLGAEVTPEQINQMKDALTVKKLEIVCNTYQQIFPGLTAEQKAFILQQLTEGREEAIDAGTMVEKSQFFKKHKTQIEAYLTAQGYDVKKSSETFDNKQRAETAARGVAAHRAARLAKEAAKAAQLAAANGATNPLAGTNKVSLPK